MSNTSSPTHYAAMNDDGMYDLNFTKDISQKMRVPKKIRGTGYTSDDDVGHNGHSNGHTGSWGGPVAHEKFDMHVPERIMVVGQEQHIGTKAQPIEIMLENATIPHEYGNIRVSTPPRVLTLSEHYFPSVDDPPAYSSPEVARIPHLRRGVEEIDDDSFIINTRPKQHFGMQMSQRDTSTIMGPAGEGLTATEEVLHLRRQMAKLNRRVLAIELDYLQRQQREKVMYAVGIAYMLLKAIMWLNRS